MKIAPGVKLTDAQSAYLREKAAWVWRETLRIHKRAPETRIASSLSPIEVFVALYYGGVLAFDPRNPRWEGRDRVIVSKGHGSVAMYPILADLGFFDREELTRVGTVGSFLGGIPDPVIPGYETVNGSLGHGPGVACGMALALKKRKSSSRVYVMVGEGELDEGAVWEAIMFAGHHRLDNLTLIVDSNAKCMLGYSAQVLDLLPLRPKFEAFGWRVEDVDGHDVAAVHAALQRGRAADAGKPFALVANTVKGRGVPVLENDPICHVRTLKPDEVDRLTGDADAADARTHA